MIKNSEKYPLLSTEWNYDKNKKGFDEIKRSDSNFYWWNCNECKNEIYLTINRRLTKKKDTFRCPYCSSSKNSKNVYLALQNSKITFKVEEVMPDLFGLKGSNLRFDYALYENEKLLGLIEYDGQYHDGTLSVIESDELKNAYCLDKKIPLLRLNHNENHMIHQCLHNFLIDFKIKFNEEYLNSKVKEEINDANKEILKLESKRKNILRNLSSLDKQIENLKNNNFGEKVFTINDLIINNKLDFADVGFLMLMYYEYAKNEDRKLRINNEITNKSKLIDDILLKMNNSVSNKTIQRKLKSLEENEILRVEVSSKDKRITYLSISKNILF